MGCHIDVFSSSHKKDDMVKKFGAENVVIWTEGEHLMKQKHYDVILNTLPCELDVN